MTISYLFLLILQYVPLKCPDEMIPLPHFSVHIYIELSVTQSDVIPRSDFTTRMSARIAFVMWISDCIATCCADLPGECSSWSLDLMITGLWAFTAPERDRETEWQLSQALYKTHRDARFDLHKLPQPNFSCNSAKFPSENFCHLLKIQVSVRNRASC